MDNPQNESSAASTTQSAESTYDGSTVSEEVTIESPESWDNPLEDPPVTTFFNSGGVYSDDELVPDRWIPVDTLA